ncbi:hypothetical protein CM19_13035 [Candidatus Acidianus copahuensis]|uniref:Uncharacterized protein n=1 Tax=Candidatus Acidianus copahuensis TaxID=1160895 RepID=A0A031LJ06_9CREN|nr:hypothetical protein [Candidatus Acidianus copahuensis]EZQ01536.1 hypothetical protein CM19_13035 [Candidatus Acidianus copahuensis]
MSNNPFLVKILNLLDRDTYGKLLNTIKRDIQISQQGRQGASWKGINLDEISSKVLEDVLREYLKRSKYSKDTDKSFEDIVNVALSKNRVLEKQNVQVKKEIYGDLHKELGRYDYNTLKNALIYTILKNKGNRER